MTEKFQSKGDPLNFPETEELAKIEQSDIVTAIATASRRLKSFLTAKSDGR
jgi:hypothetical protein